MILSVPTKLTVLRMVLAVVIVVCLLVPGLLARGSAFLLFLVASLTDWLDGYLARRSHQVTPVGVLLDPIADKVLVIGVLGALVVLGVVPAWMAGVIVARELLITAARVFAATRRVVIPAAKEGKQKTVSQMVTIGVILGVLAARELPLGRSGAVFVQRGRWLIDSCLWVTVVLTVCSGVSFFWRNRSVLRLGGPPSA